MVGDEKLEDEHYFYSCPKLRKNKTETFEEVSVESLSKTAFLIPNYQRGYKWEKEQLDALLNDLYSSFYNNQVYALQPLVVREIEPDDNRICFDFHYNAVTKQTHNKKEYVELIDGQQRLTSLFLILSHIDKSVGTRSEQIEIYYQTKRFTDETYVEAAKRHIGAWFDAKWQKSAEKNVNEIANFQKHILLKTFFFRYRLSANSAVPPEELFATINKSIRLTNAELLKALLLNSKKNQSRKTLQLSFEWDQIERRMNETDFWSFLTDETYEGKTKIDLLLDIAAKHINRVQGKSATIKEENPLFSYFVLSNYIEEHSIQDLWLKIEDVFGFLLRCYRDYHLFHYIGFLTHSSSGKKKLDLAKLYDQYKEIEFITFKEHVYECVKNAFNQVDLDALNYVRDQADLRDVLLYFNIYITMENPRHTYRFPFHTHSENIVTTEDGEKRATWQLEHINPRNPDQVFEAKINPKIIAQAYLGVDADNETEIKETIKKLENDPDAPFNGIRNLCLLDSVTNIAYKNAPFDAKKSEIIQVIKEYAYVPIATERVFLRALWSEKKEREAIDLHLWSFDDQNRYMERLRECFAFNKPHFEE